jgi:hypothetical protein
MYRVYNGCPDDELKEQIKKEHALMNEIRAFEPEACLTYFPMEGYCVVHVWGRELGRGASKIEALTNTLNEYKA